MTCHVCSTTQTWCSTLPLNRACAAVSGLVSTGTCETTSSGRSGSSKLLSTPVVSGLFTRLPLPSTEMPRTIHAARPFHTDPYRRTELPRAHVNRWPAHTERRVSGQSASATSPCTDHANDPTWRSASCAKRPTAEPRSPSTVTVNSHATSRLSMTQWTQPFGARPQTSAERSTSVAAKKRP